MEKNTKIVIGAILILFIAMVSFKFEALTGAVSKENTMINVDKDVVRAGEWITVTVKSNYWLDNRDGYGACFYVDGRRKSCTRSLCNTDEGTLYKCKENIFNYRIPTSWKPLDGEKVNAYVSVREYSKFRNTGNWIKGGEFIIKGDEKVLPHYDKYDKGKILGENK